MERESFEDDVVADMLNKYYIAIKVDREERPDIDHIYMTACQTLTGQGGWPLTVIMTPDAKPFFAGTYFPKESRYGRPGLLDVLHTVQIRWSQQKEAVVGYAEELTKAIATKKQISGELSEHSLTAAYQGLHQSFDTKYGGFGNAPKFPIPHNLMFLMRYGVRAQQPEAIHMVAETLGAMRNGGIFDHLGYGFSRYSVDNKWLVPHFEKMLYDNALLCGVYLEAYQITQNQEFAETAEQILMYLLRDMQDEQGGFYSAEDADSEGVEGKFYVWTRAEILSVLGEEKGKVFAEFYNVTAEGNFEHGTSILNCINNNIDEFAQRLHMSLPMLEVILKEGRQSLYNVREKRIHPFKDKKILTGWNALTIVALVKAAKILGKKEYLMAGEQCLKFIFSKLVKGDRLLARYKDEESDFPAYIDDYAFLLWALIESYEAAGNAEYLKRALELSQAMKRLFWDEDNGGFFFSGSDAQGLIMRSKEVYDGAVPSGNSVAAFALLRLARLTDEPDLVILVEKLLTTFMGEVEKYPQAYSFFLMALDLYLSLPTHVLISGNKSGKDTLALIDIVHKAFLPHVTLLFNDNYTELANVKMADGLKAAVNGKAAVYICENLACHQPIAALEELADWVERKSIVSKK